MGLSHAPLSLVCKSVAVMSEELLLDTVPQAWELLLEHDNEVGAGRFTGVLCYMCIVLSPA